MPLRCEVPQVEELSGLSHHTPTVTALWVCKGVTIQSFLPDQQLSY